jgi:chromosome partitioning protein
LLAKLNNAFLFLMLFDTIGSSFLKENPMPVIAVVNPKGGVGKTTLATNLAGYFAAKGNSTMLGDFDEQQSARHWLGLRPTTASSIQTWELSAGIAKPPKGVTHVVLDTPAAMQKKFIADVVRVADKILVPLQPSMFDVLATGAFLKDLEAIYSNNKTGKTFKNCVSIVGMRVDARTKAAEQLERFVAGLELPVAAYLRDTQNYVHLAAHGLTLFDVPKSRVDKDIASWQALMKWVG